ncbi:hypothetical protein HDU77_009273 [Chytriomyces hyalinus]|nr:hypothetical protein HDU77_009273 [Chytriomyces hyalinus]
MSDHPTAPVNETLHQVHFIVPAILSGISLVTAFFLLYFIVKVECQQKPPNTQSLLMNALLVFMLLCEFAHALLIALSNYYYFIQPSVYQAVAYLILGIGQSSYIHFAYFRSRPIIRNRVSPQIAQAIRVTVQATPAIVPIPGILFIVAFFHPLPKSIIPYIVLATTLFTMAIDLVFICVFAGQIRAMQSDIAVNPALVIIARYGLLANSIGISGFVSFILGYIFSGNSPGGVGHIVFSFFTQIFVFLMCMACLVMKVKLVRLKDNEDVGYSGLADDTHFRNQPSKK